MLKILLLGVANDLGRIVGVGADRWMGDMLYDFHNALTHLSDICQVNISVNGTSQGPSHI